MSKKELAIVDSDKTELVTFKPSKGEMEFQVILDGEQDKLLDSQMCAPEFKSRSNCILFLCRQQDYEQGVAPKVRMTNIIF